jgi:hypothetical protein
MQRRGGALALQPPAHSRSRSKAEFTIGLFAAVKLAERGPLRVAAFSDDEGDMEVEKGCWSQRFSSTMKFGGHPERDGDNLRW